MFIIPIFIFQVIILFQNLFELCKSDNNWLNYPCLKKAITSNNKTAVCLLQGNGLDWFEQNRVEQSEQESKTVEPESNQSRTQSNQSETQSNAVEPESNTVEPSHSRTKKNIYRLTLFDLIQLCLTVFWFNCKWPNLLLGKQRFYFNQRTNSKIKQLL